MKIGIAIDRWKFEFFSKHLKEAGFKFTTGGRVTPDTMILYVVVDSAESLKLITEAANDEATKSRQHKGNKL